MIGVGFEPTPPKRPVPETGALDRSAIQPNGAAPSPHCKNEKQTAQKHDNLPRFYFCRFPTLSVFAYRPRGLMDKALVSGAKDCGFESRRGYICIFFVQFESVLGRSTRLTHSAIGVVVSIVASQAIDPGSIPGWRTSFLCFLKFYF